MKSALQLDCASGYTLQQASAFVFSALRAHYRAKIADREFEIEHLRKKVRQCDEIESEAEKIQRAEKRALSKAMKKTLSEEEKAGPNQSGQCF